MRPATVRAVAGADSGTVAGGRADAITVGGVAVNDQGETQTRLVWQPFGMPLSVQQFPGALPNTLQVADRFQSAAAP